MRTAAAVAAAIAALFCACAPVRTSRIGPAMPPRDPKCAVEFIEEGNEPARPYRDVGLVTVESCEDWRMEPCRRWVAEAICELGGQVAYVTEYKRPDPGNAPLRAQVLAAVYVADLRPDPATDPLLRSRTCDPPCGAGQRCVNRECVAAPDCEAAAAAAEGPAPTAEPSPPPATAEAPEKCLE